MRPRAASLFVDRSKEVDNEEDSSEVDSDVESENESHNENNQISAVKSEGLKLHGEEKSSDWTKEDTIKMIKKVNESVRDDKLTYVTQFKKIKWDNIAENHTPEETKAHFETILAKVRKYRLIQEICDDMETFVDTNSYDRMYRPTMPISAFNLFLKENKDEIKAKMNTLGEMSNFFTVGSEMYNAIPENKKQLYIQRFEMLKTDYRALYPYQIRKRKSKEKTFESDFKNNRPTPFYFYYVQKKTESRKNKKQDLKEQWKSLPMNQKVEFIKLALNYTSKTESKNCVLKAEIELLRNYEGCPQKPPINGYVYYLQKHKEENDAKALRNKWLNLSTIEKQKYTSKCNKLKEKYNVKYKEYLESLPEDRRIMELGKLKTKKRIRSQTDRGKNSPKKKKAKRVVTKTEQRTDDNEEMDDESNEEDDNVNDDEPKEEDTDVETSDEEIETKSVIKKEKSGKTESKETKTNDTIVEPPKEPIRPYTDLFEYYQREIYTGKNAKKRWLKVSKDKKKEIKNQYDKAVLQYLEHLQAYLTSLTRKDMLEYIEKNNLKKGIQNDEEEDEEDSSTDEDSD